MLCRDWLKIRRYDWSNDLIDDIVKGELVHARHSGVWSCKLSEPEVYCYDFQFLLKTIKRT